MSFKIPSLRQAKSLVKKNDAFIGKTNKVNGKSVYQVDYLLASPKDFRVTPYAKEMRGTCYVTKWFGLATADVFPMLHKFHNLNECEGYMLDEIKDWYVSSVYVKEDGSVINFIKIGDKFFAKSKYSFESYQAKKAQELYNKNKELRKFIDHCYQIDCVPIFELTGSENAIVVKYGDLALTLLQVRRMNGEYLTDRELQSLHYLFPSIKRCHVEPNHLEKFGDLYQHFYKNRVETETDIEGWIFRISKGDETRFVKLKTKWYIELHGLLTGTSIYANNIISFVIDGTIDDVVSSMALDEDDHRKIFINGVIEKIDKYFNEQYNRITNIVFGEEKDLSTKELAMKYKEDELISVIMKVRRGFDLSEKLKEHILWNTRRKEMAEKFLEEIE